MLKAKVKTYKRPDKYEFLNMDTESFMDNDNEIVRLLKTMKDTGVYSQELKGSGDVTVVAFGSVNFDSDRAISLCDRRHVHH